MAVPDTIVHVRTSRSEAFGVPSLAEFALKLVLNAGSTGAHVRKGTQPAIVAAWVGAGCRRGRAAFGGPLIAHLPRPFMARLLHCVRTTRAQALYSRTA